MSPPLLLCYQLGQLMSFYQGLLVDILGPTPPRVNTITSLQRYNTIPLATCIP